MAEEELELDVNESKGGNKTVILIIVGVFLLNAVGIGAWLFLREDKSSTAEKKEKVLAPLEYLTMVPEFIVNFGPGSKVRYLQVDLQIATRDKDALEAISTYRPVLRNDILVVLSDVRYKDLKDRAGKEALQKRLLTTINKVIIDANQPKTSKDKGNKGDVPGKKNIKKKKNVKGPVENVYYISFIMQ